MDRSHRQYRGHGHHSPYTHEESWHRRQRPLPSQSVLRDTDEDLDRKVELAYKKRLYKDAKRRGKVNKALEAEFRNIQLEDDGFLDEVITVNEINKRVLGKVIIKYCGHEGTIGTQQSHSLRKLLQACIDNIQHYPDKLWTNADITIYDIDDNTFRIISGHGKYKFIVSDNNGTPEVVNMSSRGVGSRNEQGGCILL